MENNKFIGVWIESSLIEINELNCIDMVVYSIIKSMSSNGGVCFVSNGYFAKIIKTNNDTARRVIKKLELLGYITKQIDYSYKSQRVLKITDKVDNLQNSNVGYLNTNNKVLKNTNPPIAKISTNNKDNINTTTTEKLKSNIDLNNSLIEDLKISEDSLINLIEKFVKYNDNTKKPPHKNDNDLYNHFNSWIRKQNLEKFELEKEFDWFMNKFKQISNSDFIPTEKTKRLFKIQFKNGFKGKQMVKAVINLYSSSPGNKFHIDSNFKYATPDYLLKDDNLNRYLNVKY